WCGADDFPGLKDEFAKFREKFKLIDPTRKGWKEFRANVIDYKGDTVNYTISDAEGFWKEAKAEDMPELKMVSPRLDKRLYMRLTPRRDRKALPDSAELSVYLLPGVADATQEARRFAEEMEIQRIKEANQEFTPVFVEVTDD